MSPERRQPENVPPASEWLNNWARRNPWVFAVGPLIGIGLAGIAVLAALGIGPVATPASAFRAMNARVSALDSTFGAHNDLSNEIHRYLIEGQERNDIALCRQFVDEVTRALMKLDCVSILAGRPTIPGTVSFPRNRR